MRTALYTGKVARGERQEHTLGALHRICAPFLYCTLLLLAVFSVEVFFMVPRRMKLIDTRSALSRAHHTPRSPLSPTTPPSSSLSSASVPPPPLQTPSAASLTSATICSFVSWQEPTQVIVNRLQSANVLGDPFVIEGDIVRESQRAPHGVAILVNTLGRAATYTNFHHLVEHFDNADIYAYHSYDKDVDFHQANETVHQYAAKYPSLRAIDVQKDPLSSAYLQMVHTHQRDARALAAIIDRAAVCRNATFARGVSVDWAFKLAVDAMLFSPLCLNDPDNHPYKSAVYLAYAQWRVWQLLRAGEARRGARYEYVVFAREDAFYFRMPPSISALRNVSRADMWVQSSESNFGWNDRLILARRAAAEAYARAFEWLFHVRDARLAAYASHFGAERGLLLFSRLVGAKHCELPGIVALACCGGFHCRRTHKCAPLDDARAFDARTRLDLAANVSLHVACKYDSELDSFNASYAWFANKLRAPTQTTLPSPLSLASLTLSASPTNLRRNSACSLHFQPLREHDASNGNACRIGDLPWPHALPCERTPIRRRPLGHIFAARGDSIDGKTLNFLQDLDGARTHEWPWLLEEHRASASAMQLYVAP